MREYASLSKSELQRLQSELRARYEELRGLRLSLDMSRGKPSAGQLDLSNSLIDDLTAGDYMAGEVDCRNYGGLDGIAGMKRIFADILGVLPGQVIVGGNSSLAMMFDSVAANMTHGVRNGEPWAAQGRVKFLCPVPGYDRHFSICEYFHIEMIPVPMDENGPNMDIVESLVSRDHMIKGMWCVPKYSNPEGIVYSDEVVRRIAALRPKARDFRVYWDDAYTIHHLYGDLAKIPNILEECEKAGNPDMCYIFASLSKVSFGGAAVSCMCSSDGNVGYIKKRLSVQMIGPDKINQLRHVRFFKDAAGVRAQMDRHAAILRPKFELALETFGRELDGVGCRWTRPRGGYFISFYSIRGCAVKIVGYCGECGLTLTAPGSTYPYGKDYDDSNIRIAPSFPGIEELRRALEVFCVCVKLATVEKLLAASAPLIPPR
ncbi:MAG: aminotransferase [Clostridiales bacterium]|jgi:aspartate/methionine/tyrosine aminotransferase|nr:aminotransferase [Clostridiales bacterium]